MRAFTIEEDRSSRYRRLFKLVARDSWNGEIGRITVNRPRYARFSDIYGIRVEPAFQRRGVGTALYEAAAALSCTRLKAPLASSTVRSPMADQFWRKQYVKNRAHCSRWVGGAGQRWCEHYVLSCPAPRDLGYG